MSEKIVSGTNQGLYKPRMNPNTPGKLKYGRTFLIGLAFLTSSIAWSYYNFMMPILLEEFLDDLGVEGGKDTLIGLIMVLDNIVAIMLLPYFGALSDRTKSKYGKRTPFIMVGCVGGIVGFSLIGIISPMRGIGVFIGLIAIVMFFNFSMAFYRSSSVSLMPDNTDPEVQSEGNAIINLMGAVAMVIGLAIPMITKIMFDVETPVGEANSRAMGFYLTSLFTTIALVLLLLTIKETPTGEKFMEFSSNSIAIDPVTLEYLGEQNVEKKESRLEGLKNIFQEKEKSTLFMLLVVFTWFFGYNAIDTFYSLYATQFMGWEDAQASSTLMVAPITMIITAIFAGKLGDNMGRKRTIFIGLVGLAACVTVMMFLRTQISVTILMGVVGIFYGMININTIVIVWGMAPEGKIGSYTGAYYFFSQLSATLSPVFAGALFDIYAAVSNVADGQQYIAIFPYVIFFELLAMVWLFRVKRGETKKFTDQQIKDLQNEYGDD
jgi:maltose/moltooligosaccharide transporter